MLLSVETHSRVTPFVRALERRDFVSRPLKFLRQNSIGLVHLHAVDELDVGGPAPRRHQAIGLRAAVLVREDHGITVLPAAGRRHDFVPHQQRQIGELPDGVGPRVDDRRHRQRGVVGASRKEHGHVGSGHVQRHGPGAGRGHFRIAIEIEPVLACRHPPERETILGKPFTADELEVL